MIDKIRHSISVSSVNYIVIILFTFFFTYSFDSNCQKNKIRLGAYYFDGWTGKDFSHITKSLKDSFSEREPKLGWITSTQKNVDTQIREAAASGLSFFSFCWYYGDKYKTEPLNQALRFYQSSPEKNKMKYCLMVANHKGFLIGPAEWPVVVENWLQHFKSPDYLSVDSKPLIIFFSIATLIKSFGSVGNVHAALDSFRLAAKNSGLKGITIAVCLSPDSNAVSQAEASGFDILTGYNYHVAGFTTKQKQIPIDSMQSAEYRLWNKFKSISRLKYIPASTLGWDPRPWANTSNNYANASYFTGFSSKSVYRSVRNCIDWLKTNENFTTKEKIGILYAWNEYGEGAYLTPSKNGNSILKGVAKALKK